ncbi:hypothetical protein AKJ38_01860 [candidate division MSBL1 archaeon SCGC-AAA259I14]|uniref:Uncharacterized protein n=1 Tax=candidate division MSBL1 archaeon SCGC-AAA259I14 TaxID=1698268 RepID=A0A133USD8_9EURY|nr:hypothetical protein AKJ38_01860 [candidate division MSBL1 archaeon SCGC-AAA259I14]
MNRTQYAVKFLEKLTEFGKAKRVSTDFILERDGFNLPSDDTRVRAIKDFIDLGILKGGGNGIHVE